MTSVKESDDEIVFESEWRWRRTYLFLNERCILVSGTYKLSLGPGTYDSRAIVEWFVLDTLKISIRLRWMIPPMVVYPEKIDFRRFV